MAIITQTPPLIHTLYNPILVKVEKEVSDNPTYILTVYANLDDIITDIDREHLLDSPYITIFDISNILRASIGARVSYASPNNILPIAGTPCWQDFDLFIDYRLQGIDLTDDDFKYAINAVVQAGESSDLTSKQGTFLTKFDKLKKYVGYKKEAYALGYADPMKNIRVDFDGENVFDDSRIHIGMEVVANNLIRLNKKVLSPTITNPQTVWNIISDSHFNVMNSNLGFLSIIYYSIINNGTGRFDICFNATVNKTDRYSVKIATSEAESYHFVKNGDNCLTINNNQNPLSYLEILIYGVGADSGTCEITDFITVQETDSRKVELMPTPENPFYVRWINQQGGYDSWMFSYRQFFSKSISNQQSFSPVVFDQSAVSGFSNVYAMQGSEQVRVGAAGLTSNEFDCISKLIYSPKIEWWNEKTSTWINLIVSNGNSERDNHNVLGELEFTFNLPEPQLQF